MPSSSSTGKAVRRTEKILPFWSWYMPSQLRTFFPLRACISFSKAVTVACNRPVRSCTVASMLSRAFFKSVSAFIRLVISMPFRNDKGIFCSKKPASETFTGGGLLMGRRDGVTSASKTVLSSFGISSGEASGFAGLLSSFLISRNNIYIQSNIRYGTP